MGVESAAYAGGKVIGPRRLAITKLERGSTNLIPSRSAWPMSRWRAIDHFPSSAETLPAGKPIYVSLAGVGKSSTGPMSSP